MTSRLFSAVPGIPYDLHASRIGTDYLTLKWSPPVDDGGSKITSYLLEKVDGICGEWIIVDEVKSFNTMYKVTGCSEDFEYFYAVSAKNCAGSGMRCQTETAIKAKKPEGYTCFQ